MKKKNQEHVWFVLLISRTVLRMHFLCNAHYLTFTVSMATKGLNTMMCSPCIWKGRCHRRGWRGRRWAERGWPQWRWSSSPPQAWSCTVQTYTGRRPQTACLQNMRNGRNFNQTNCVYVSNYSVPLMLSNTLTYKCESPTLSLPLHESPEQLCNTKQNS